MVSITITFVGSTSGNF